MARFASGKKARSIKKDFFPDIGQKKRLKEKPKKDFFCFG